MPFINRSHKPSEWVSMPFFQQSYQLTYISEGTSPVKAMGNNKVQASLAISPKKGPVIVTPYRTRQSRQPITLPFPADWNSATPGYQDAHSFYYEMRKHFEDKAKEKTKLALEVITVTASMAYRSPKKRKEEVLGVSRSNLVTSLRKLTIHPSSIFVMPSMTFQCILGGRT